MSSRSSLSCLRFLVIDATALAGRRVIWLVTVVEHLHTRVCVVRSACLFKRQWKHMTQSHGFNVTISLMEKVVKQSQHMDGMVSSRCIDRLLMNLLLFY